MVSATSVENQFKRLKFNQFGWGKAEARELPNILLEDEKIFECVNGIYDGGFALLVATNVRLILVDKKPLNFLTVEDLRFDMITEIDYSHRMIGAHISISAGSKNLSFRSYNQARLRKLINHVQHSMAASKKKQSDSQDDQQEHLAQINKQLQSYLLATHQQQQALQEQLKQAQSQGVELKNNFEPVKPSPELADYLLAQSLLSQANLSHLASSVIDVQPEQGSSPPVQVQQPSQLSQQSSLSTERGLSPSTEMKALYAEGMQEIYGRYQAQEAQVQAQAQPAVAAAPHSSTSPSSQITPIQFSQDYTDQLEINPLKIAYSKLPMALRNRRFGRPSFHAHSQAQAPTATPFTAP